MLHFGGMFVLFAISKLILQQFLVQEKESFDAD
jgi:hypothetical protein